MLRKYIDGRFKNESSGEVSIGTFTTFALVRDNIKYTQEAPVTYLEDGSHVNDHIISNPILVKIEGDISNVHVKPSPPLAFVRGVETTFGSVAQYLPGRTQAQLSKVAGITADIQQQVDRINGLIQAGQNVASFLGLTDQENSSNIEAFIDHMSGLLESKALITISGPTRTYDKMCILAFEYTSDNMSEDIGFSLEAQELRFAETTFSEIVENPDEATDGQQSGVTEKGAQEGNEVDESFLIKYGGKAVNFIKKIFE